RNRAAVLRAHLSNVSAAAYARTVLGHRDWTRDLPADRRAPRRPDLGRIATGRGVGVLFHHPPAGHCRAGPPTPDAEGTAMNSRTIEILLVEDNPGDARLTLEAFKEGRVLNHICVVKDGVEALAYLRKEGAYASACTPDLILLDLNLPRKS